MSASGRTVIFNSNMGVQPFKDYTDIYAIQLTAADFAD